MTSRCSPTTSSRRCRPVRAPAEAAGARGGGPPPGLRLAGQCGNCATPSSASSWSVATSSRPRTWPSSGAPVEPGPAAPRRRTPRRGARPVREGVHPAHPGRGPGQHVEDGRDPRRRAVEPLQKMKAFGTPRAATTPDGAAGFQRSAPARTLRHRLASLTPARSSVGPQLVLSTCAPENPSSWRQYRRPAAAPPADQADDLARATATL